MGELDILIEDALNVSQPPVNDSETFLIYVIRLVTCKSRQENVLTQINIFTFVQTNGN
jgi:hypothetical protein